MSRQRAGFSSRERRSSFDAQHTTQLVQDLARTVLSGSARQGEPSAAPSETEIHGALRLCIRILTSHIGEPLMAEDEASVTQAIRTRLVKVKAACSLAPYRMHTTDRASCGWYARDGEGGVRPPPLQYLRALTTYVLIGLLE